MKDIKPFESLDIPTPSFAVLQRKYEEIIACFEAAESYDQEAEALAQWQDHAMHISSWSSLTNLRFMQDTANKMRKQEQDFSDEILPQLQAFDVRMKRLLLDSSRRAQHADVHGEHIFALWEVDVESFRPEIQDELIAINKLVAEYAELMASAEVKFMGEDYNLSQLRKFASEPDRDKREGAVRAKWDWVLGASTEFDRIFDELVALRHSAAQKLGYKDFVELGYKLMRRTDYTRADVEQFRDEVRRIVVPLCQELREYQREQLGLEKLSPWDLELFAPTGNPRPHGDHDWMVARAREMFDEMGHGLGDFFGIMADKGYLDLKARKGKCGGGFCTAFPTEHIPFVFANFNGTEGDVRVFSHEMGHAFQFWSSAEFPLEDYHWPTYEAAEIHSMSLEFLTWPHMDKFFEDEADRFRTLHLIEGLIFLPYGVAVDHFQHMVYEEPEATPARRREMWKEVEALYLPWIDWGDVEHGANGGRWHLQSHIFQVPFYYIDYTLAQSCALQFWRRSAHDFEGAMTTYAELCKQGGSQPFQQLVKSAGLTSPFTPGCLEEVIEHAREVLAPVLKR